jgi:hypothetical protein
MEEPCLACSIPRPKVRRGDRSVDTVKATLVGATSAQQTLLSWKLGMAAQNPTVIIEACGIKSTRVEALTDPVTRGAVGW